MHKKDFSKQVAEHIGARALGYREWGEEAVIALCRAIISNQSLQRIPPYELFRMLLQHAAWELLEGEIASDLVAEALMSDEFKIHFHLDGNQEVKNAVCAHLFRTSGDLTPFLTVSDDDPGIARSFHALISGWLTYKGYGKNHTFFEVPEIGEHGEYVDVRGGITKGSYTKYYHFGPEYGFGGERLLYKLSFRPGKRLMFKSTISCTGFQFMNHQHIGTCPSLDFGIQMLKEISNRDGGFTEDLLRSRSGKGKNISGYLEAIYDDVS
jgi:hypothetical protein